MDPKVFSTPNFFDTNFFDPIIFYPKLFWTQIIFGPKILLDPNYFLVTDFFDDQKRFSSKNCGTKFFLDPTFFAPNFLDLRFLDQNIIEPFLSNFFIHNFWTGKVFGPNNFGPQFWTKTILDQKYWLARTYCFTWIFSSSKRILEPKICWP